MNTPHKHAAIIKAWADGAQIELSLPNMHAWTSTKNPNWRENLNYRVKPTEKTYWFNVYKHKKTGKITIGEAHSDKWEVLKYATSPTFESVEYLKTESFTVME